MKWFLLYLLGLILSGVFFGVLGQTLYVIVVMVYLFYLVISANLEDYKKNLGE